MYFFCVNQNTFSVDSITPSINTITLHQSTGEIHPLPQVKSLYSCHLAWIDVVFLTSKSSKVEAFLSDDVETVTLFLPFSLDRRGFFDVKVKRGRGILVGRRGNGHSIPAI
jgi:hypothetical protein